MSGTVLIVDDEKNIRRTLRIVLEGASLGAVEAGTGEEALEILRSKDIDLVILDVRLPTISGIETLASIRQRPETRAIPVLMISGHASIAEAVHAVQLGATDFFEKPLDRDRILISVRNALRSFQLAREVEQLRASVEERYAMVGESAVMQKLYSELEKIAPTKGRVLITGESGTGKEHIARAIHRLSPRKEGAFIKVNCAAIPAELIESELFGYERGAFTGAQGRKKGMFELADQGTLFLDEIGDMSLSAQAKVLRALQSGEIARLGSETTVPVDVRVLAATNKDLEQSVADGEFREDLYFRINVVPIRSPSLRERREDVPLLVRTFLREFALENGTREKPIDPEVVEALSLRSWPGNVRELKNVVERMAILSGDRITLEDLPIDPRERTSSHSQPAVPSFSGSERVTLREYRDMAERSYIVETLQECEWNISRAASVLGVERTNLHKKMRAFGIRREG